MVTSRQKCLRQQHNAGFTYLGVLFFLAIMSITLAMASTLWSFAQQREKERELRFIGNQFRQAIGLYYERTPGTIKKYPSRLEDLLQDNRYVTTQRYLRKIYRDPMTNAHNWGLVPAFDGGIMGVYSQSEATPIKVSLFSDEGKVLEGAKKYTGWQFVYLPK